MSLSNLETWVKSQGGKWTQNVSFSTIAENNFGAVYSSDTPSNVSIEVPTQCIIKLSDAVKHLGNEFESICRQTRNINCVTKLFLARERSPAYLDKSQFKPYIETLPSMRAINSPYVWSAEEKACLQGSNLGSSLRQNIGELIEEWWLVISLLPESVAKPDNHFLNMKFYYEHKFYTEADLAAYVTEDNHSNWTSFASYLWASMIMKSRAFPSYLLKECLTTVDALDVAQEDVTMLIPVVDLLNHNPKALVSWGGASGSFKFESHDDYSRGDQVFNNYGQKGNEELLLAYGFCIENNPADSVVLKIKVPEELLPELEKNGVQLPSLSDYTTSVVHSAAKVEDKQAVHKDGLLFFISKDRVPENLVLVFQWLVKSKWEGEKLTLRMKLSGLNHLRQALESKTQLLDVNRANGASNEINIKIYLKGQKKLLEGGVKKVKHLEKELLAENKGKLLSLKTVYKRDIKFAQSLLVTMGVTSYEDILLEQLLDQVWLLYLIRCYNRKEYVKSEEDEEENYLPEWITKCFERMDQEIDIPAAEVLQFRELYENLILPMNQAVPEIYNVGQWTVRQLIVSTKVMDTIGFVRGKEQECILVNDFE
ncbi:CIC11C00000002709 [Sungouiella intermedia]|uniref:CIC11C00000002709 n=1 Tax=Sungouiella intermedia TaxID=45354 RepID=A0A1L0FZU3_9ASCO|nr:CIC11C00000002709 [[Candida] intermedia]